MPIGFKSMIIVSLIIWQVYIYKKCVMKQQDMVTNKSICKLFVFKVVFTILRRPSDGTPKNVL